jgi:hypothetical protein
MLENSWQTHQLPSFQEGMCFMELPVVTTTKDGFIHSLLFISKANNMCNEYGTYLCQIYMLFLMFQKTTKIRRDKKCFADGVHQGQHMHKKIFHTSI